MAETSKGPKTWVASPDEMNIDVEFGRFSDEAQILFIRLRQKPVSDTAHNGVANPSTIKGLAFAFAAKWDETKIVKYLNELERGRWLYFYPSPNHPGVPYFHICKWAEYDKRKAQPVHPAPAPGDATAGWNPFMTPKKAVAAPAAELLTRVLDAWNTEKIKVHEKFPSDAETALKNLIAEFDIDAVLKGIQSYAEILRSPDTYFKHKWTLSEFLRRKGGCRVFMYKTVSDYKTKQKGGDNTNPSSRTFEAQEEQAGKFDHD